MNVALDATPLSVPIGGISRYTAELSRALAREHPADVWRLISDQPFALPADAPPNLKKGAPPTGPLARRWWSLGVAAELLRRRTTLFHGTDFAVPYLPLRPAVMTVHDLSPWRDPSWHNAAGRVRRRAPVLLGLGLATMVITPTESIRREVMERFRIPPGRIAAVPLAASGNFRPAPAPPRDKPYFLHVGVLEPRKNLPLLLATWRAVRERHDVDLILAGRRRSGFPPLPEEPGLHVMGEVPESDLPGLYSGAAAVVCPSHYEGFGLPVLEAMQCGAPVLTSGDPAISEVAAGAAIRLDPGRGAAWTEAMTAILLDADLRRRRSGLSLARSRFFSWANTARLTRQVYEEALHRFGG